jgi:hypothetical protein
VLSMKRARPVVTTSDITRAACLEMLRAGLATQAEVAELARVSRQYIHKLAVAENIDAVAERKAWLKKAWQEMIRHDREPDRGCDLA